MTSRPTLFVFDWDGTLSNSTARIVAACTQVVREMGLPDPGAEAIQGLIGLSLEQTFYELLPDAGSRDVTRAARRYREIWALGSVTPAPLFRGAQACLEHLRGSGALVAVATGKGRRGLDEDLRVHALTELVVTTRCADDGPPKPAPDMLLDILDELGVPAGQALMVGDTTFDMAMARAAGVARLGLRSGVHDEQSLREYSPLAVLDGIADLLPWLEEPVPGAAASAATQADGARAGAAAKE
jgi:phosphoglycolate phosphatase